MTERGLIPLTVTELPHLVRRLVAERRIRFYKVGKYVRIHSDDLSDYLQDGRVEPLRPVLTRTTKGETAYG